MTDKRVVLRAGTLVVIDSGEYSDYGLDGFFVTLAEFDPIALRDELIAQHDEDKYLSVTEYLAFLTSKGLIMEIRPARIYVGTYRFEEFSVQEMMEL